MNDFHCDSGSSRLAAAKNAQSAELSWGRSTCRRRTVSSCLRTTISSSLDSFERGRRSTSCSKQRKARYQNDQNKRARLLGIRGDGDRLYVRLYIRTDSELRANARSWPAPTSENRINAPHTPRTRARQSATCSDRNRSRARRAVPGRRGHPCNGCCSAPGSTSPHRVPAPGACDTSPLGSTLLLMLIQLDRGPGRRVR